MEDRGEIEEELIVINKEREKNYIDDLTTLERKIQRQKNNKKKEEKSRRELLVILKKEEKEYIAYFTTLKERLETED